MNKDLIVKLSVLVAVWSVIIGMVIINPLFAIMPFVGVGIFVTILVLVS